MQNNKKDLHVDLIGFDSGWGCRDAGCADGPEAVSIDQILAFFRQHNVVAHWQGALGLKKLADHAALAEKQQTLPLVLESLNRLAAAVRQSVQAGRMPVVLGGDHSSAIATWSAATAATASAGEFGLIWVDAHLDSHTEETAWQGKFGGWWHGQPVAALTGHGLPAFTGLMGGAPKIDPRHLTIIGAHSYEMAEIEYVRRNNIRVITYDEVMQRGFAACLHEAVERATKGTKGFGMSIDLDVFDPADAPGVGAREDKGLDPLETIAALKSLALTPKFYGLEIVEYNPHHDIGHKTGRLITEIIASVFS